MEGVETVVATWAGPFDADLGPGELPLHVGEEAEIPLDQAYGGHWLVNGEQLQAPEAPVAEPGSEENPIVVDTSGGDAGESDQTGAGNDPGHPFGDPNEEV